MYPSLSFKNDCHVAGSVSSYPIFAFHPKLDSKQIPDNIFSFQTIWSFAMI